MKTKRVHKLLALLLALMMTFSLLPTVTWADDTFSGSGTETDPYLIGDYTALKALATKVNGGWDTDGLYFRQTADIDMSEDTKWAPIAPIAAGKCDTPFNGTYDGDGHRIKNFVYSDPSRYYYGLFGKLGSNSVLKNLSLDESCSITGLSWVGGLACSSDGYIINCANYGTVTAREMAGGIVGELRGRVEDCFNLGTVKVEKTVVGGIVGV